MSSILQILSSQFRGCYSYQPLPPKVKEKDEDLSAQQALAWIQKTPFPGDTKMYFENSEAAKEYAKKIIYNLKKVTINSSNEMLIANHLVQICRKHHIVQTYIRDHIYELNTTEQLKREFRQHTTV